jgi:23S rRNA pseudouridine955/2504/2580 synthase
MKEFTVSKKEAGTRFDKYLLKILKNCGSGLIYKSLRKKNITLNDKKADGKESLSEGDIIKIFFSDETFEKFSNGNDLNSDRSDESLKMPNDFKAPDTIYEDNDVLILNKPVGVLSQKAKADDYTITEWLYERVGMSGTFKPAVCNRLDRNTSGIIFAGKSIAGLQMLSDCLKSRKVHKYYITVVCGKVTKKECIEGYLLKKEAHNTVEIYKENVPGSSFIKTEYEPLCTNDEYTLLKVNLITGKSHQIRAHLASIGHPIIGDGKYGLRSVNEKFRKKGLTSQLLHAYETVFDKDDDLIELSGKNFKAPLPALFNDIIKNLFNYNL